MQAERLDIMQTSFRNRLHSSDIDLDFDATLGLRQSRLPDNAILHVLQIDRCHLERSVHFWGRFWGRFWSRFWGRFWSRFWGRFGVFRRLGADALPPTVVAIMK